MFQSKQLLALFTLCCAIQSIQCLKVTFYRDIHHSGAAETFNLCSNDCVSLGTNEDWNDQFSSADTHNGCIIMFENNGCQGRSVRIEPGSPSHDNFNDLQMNDMVSSIKLC